MIPLLKSSRTSEFMPIPILLVIRGSSYSNGPPNVGLCKAKPHLSSSDVLSMCWMYQVFVAITNKDYGMSWSPYGITCRLQQWNRPLCRGRRWDHVAIPLKEFVRYQFMFGSVYRELNRSRVEFRVGTRPSPHMCMSRSLWSCVEFTEGIRP